MAARLIVRGALGLGITCGAAPQLDTPLKPKFEELQQNLTIGATSLLSRSMLGFNHVKVTNREILKSAFKRESSTGLLTVTNHSSTFDSPIMMSRMFRFWDLWNRKRIPYTVGARDILFLQETPVQRFLSRWYTLLKAIPIVRGAGVFQQDMRGIIDKLDQGDWVHYFPEGRVYQQRELGTFKRGVGRLIMETRQPILVVPFNHTGMSQIQPTDPVKLIVLPRQFLSVDVKIGSPANLSAFIESSCKKLAGIRNCDICPVEIVPPERCGDAELHRTVVSPEARRLYDTFSESKKLELFESIAAELRRVVSDLKSK